jgi:psp operon transcriptional activator
VDVRIVAATNVDLYSMAQSGDFKQDLLDRLSFEVIYVPPLRYRRDDILVLANHFASRMAFELGWEDIPGISSQALNALEAYPWPGNIRELKNVIERAVYKSPTPEIKEISFNPFTCPYGDIVEKRSGPQKMGKAAEISSIQTKIDSEEGAVLHQLLKKKPFKQAMGELEYYLVSRALEGCRFNQKKAAQILGLSYDQFRGIRKKHAGRV